MDEAGVIKMLEDLIKRLAFFALLCLRQAEGGRFYAVKHPATASPWAFKFAQLLYLVHGNRNIKSDLGKLGMESKGEQGRAPAKTRAAVIEFTIWNSELDQYAAVRVLTEFPAIGPVKTTTRVLILTRRYYLFRSTYHKSYVKFQKRHWFLTFLIKKFIFHRHS